MSLRRRGPNENWEFLPAADRARVLAWESLPLGRIAALAAALVMAYLVLSGSFSPGEVSLDTGDACEDVLLRDESQKIVANVNRPVGYGSCVQPTPAQPAGAQVPAAVVPVNVATTCDDPGYEATLLSPSVPGSSDTYTYVIDGCQPDDDVSASRIGVQWEDIDYVKFSGCWQIEDIKDVRTSGGSVDLIAPGYVLVSGISDDDMPLTVEIIFPFSLENGEERTWIWVHTGPANNDGWTYRTGGPFCDELKQTPTPSPTPSPTPTQPPTPTPTQPPTPTPTHPPTDSPNPPPIDGTLAYTVTVNNIGAITASNVVVTDELPGHVTLISSTPSQGSCDDTTCSLGSIAPGEAAVISYIVFANEGAESPLLNVVCVTSSTEESDLTNNCDQEETTLKTPLGATSTPDGIPPMGGAPPNVDGAPGLSLLLVFGIGFAVIGGIAGLVARRRMTNR